MDIEKRLESLEKIIMLLSDKCMKSEASDYPLHSDQIAEIAAALSKAQGQIDPAVKDNLNPYYNSKYADLSSVMNACKKPLSINNLSITQTMIPDQKGGIVLVTTLMHSSGQWIKSYAPILMEPKDDINTDKKKKLLIQALGSAITYIRRYTLSAMVGVTPDDDDAESSRQKQKDDKISRAEADSLLRMVSACSPEYQKFYDDYLIKNKITSYEIPRDIYSQILVRTVEEKRIYKNFLDEALHEQTNKSEAV